MIKKLNKLFILLIFVISILFINNIIVSSRDDNIVVNIKASINSDNKEVVLNNDIYSYGDEIIVDFSNASNSGDFLYWIVNGVIDLNLNMNHKFIATKDLNLLAVFESDVEYAITFIDINGTLIESKYINKTTNSVSAPDVSLYNNKIGFNETGFRSIYGSINLDNIEESSVFRLTYERTTNDLFNIDVIGGESSNIFPNFNDIVEVTSTTLPFSYWEEYGNIVSYEKEYVFSALYDRELKAVYEENVDKKTFVSISYDIDFRVDYETRLAQIHLYNNDELVEWGFVGNNKEVIFKSNLLNPTTNEYLGSFKYSHDYQNIEAYIVVKRDNELVTIYSENDYYSVVEYHETFDSHILTGTYSDKTFTGVNNVEWNTIHSRNEGLETSDNYSIDGKGIMLRGKGNYKVDGVEIPITSSMEGYFNNGLDSFSFEYRKAFTGATNRKLKVEVTNNGQSQIFTIPDFGGGSGAQDNIYTFKEEDLNLSGPVIVKIFLDSNAQVTIDNFKWTEKSSFSPLDKINVFYDLNYDTTNQITTVRINKNTIPNEPIEPIREGYEFLGWYINNELYEFNTPLNETTTLLAKWEEIDEDEVIISFAGDDNIDDIISSVGETITLPILEDRRGYIFEGWYTNSSFDIEFTNNTILVKSLTLYPKWKELFEQEVLVYDFGTKADTGFGSSEFTFINGYDGNTYTLFKKQAQVNSSNTNYHSGKDQMMILSPFKDSNSESYVEFDLSNIDNISKIEFEIAPWSTSDFNNINGKTNEVYLEFYDGDHWVKLKDVNNSLNIDYLIQEEKYNFASFEIEKSGLYRIFYKSSYAGTTNSHRIVVDNFKVSAFFDMPDGNIVTFNYNYPGAPSNQIIAVPEGERVDMLNPERLGYDFDGWYLGNNLFNFDTIITGNITLIAKWTQSQIVVTLDYGYLDVYTKNENVQIGSSLSKPTNPTRDGYTFKGWFETDIGSDNHNPVSFPYTPNENVRLIASWRINNKTPDDLIRDDNNLDLIYSSVENKTGEALFNALRNIVITNHTTLSNYGNARYALEVADRHPHNSGMVLGMYDRSMLYGPWNHPIWEREHVWPNSKLGVERADNPTANQASDLHNLRAIIPTVNQRRSNRYFVDTTLNSPLGHQIGLNAYYPGNEDIGDVARIFMYMVLRYEVLSLTNDESLLRLEGTNNTPASAFMGKLEVLYKWHLLDPVDDFERNRNNVIASYQGNRNPFIDHPELFKEVWLHLTTIDNQRLASIQEVKISITNNQVVVDIYYLDENKRKYEI